MKTYLAALIVFLFLLPGCVGSMLGKTPNHEFEAFQYDRTGNFSSTHITAGPAVKKDGAMTIESIQGSTDWGPVFSMQITIDGYKRGVEGPTTALEE